MFNLKKLVEFDLTYLTLVASQIHHGELSEDNNYQYQVYQF